MSPLVGCPGPGGFLSGGAFVWGVFCLGALLAGGIFVRGGFVRGRGLLPGETFVRGAYAHSPQVQCVYAPSRLSVRCLASLRDGQTKEKQKKTNSAP